MFKTVELADTILLQDIHTCLRDEEGRKEEASKVMPHIQGSELPRVGFEPTTLYTLDRVLYHRATKAAQLAGAKSYIS